MMKRSQAATADRSQLDRVALLREVFEAPVHARWHPVAGEQSDDLACDEWLTEAMRLARNMAHAHRFRSTAECLTSQLQLESHLRQRVVAPIPSSQSA
jgi:hypothetical protein